MSEEISGPCPDALLEVTALERHLEVALIMAQEQAAEHAKNVMGLAVVVM